MRARLDQTHTGRVPALHAVAAQVVAEAVVGGGRVVVEKSRAVLGRAEGGTVPMGGLAGERNHRTQAAGADRGDERRSL